MLPALKQAGFPGFCARACFTVLLVLSSPVFGQPGQTQAAGNTSELSAHDAPATFRARVNLVMVPMVVRDRQAHAIGTLKQEDFQLFDKGKPQIISKFSVEKAGAKVVSSAIQVAPPVEDGDRAKPIENPAAAIPTRFVAYLFDDVHLDFPDLAQARTAAIHYLTASFQPTDRAAIYTTSGQGMLDFTDDLAKIREALDRIQPHSKAIPAGSDCPDMTYYMADLIQNKSDPQALNTAEQDAIVCADIIVTNGPGGGGMAAALQQAEPLARAAATRVLNLGESDTKLALSVLRNVVRRMAAVPGQRSVVLVSPGFYVPIDFRSDEGDHQLAGRTRPLCNDAGRRPQRAAAEYRHANSTGSVPARKRSDGFRHVGRTGGRYGRHAFSQQQ